MTQEVDAQTNEWITNAAPAEDTYATAPSETEYVAPVENVNGIRTLMEVGLSDVMSEEGREIVAQQQQSTAYNSMLSQAKDEMRQELNGASPDSVAGQVTNEQLDETEMRARAASDRVYGYAEARGISAEDVHNLPIWNAPNKTLEESAKEYIDTMANGSNPNQIAQSKQAAGATPARASSSSQVLTIEKMKNMSPQEIMKIPKEIRNQALRGG